MKTYIFIRTRATIEKSLMMKKLIIRKWKGETLVCTRRGIRMIISNPCTTKREDHFKTDVKKLLKCNLV